MKRDLYKEYLQKLEEALVEDNFDALDYIIEYLQSPSVTEQEREKMSDIIDEATLYIELKEEEYKTEAMERIWEYK